MKVITAVLLLVVAAGSVVCLPSQNENEALRTVAERSDFKATSRHAEVVDFCERLAKASPVVRLGKLATSAEGRQLPLLILAEPPVATAEEARRSKKLVVFAMGNIHAGEVDGKEALLLLARDVATGQARPFLKDLILVFAPNFNPDGNEKVSTENRRRQNGPEQGVGLRFNAQGLDLNRDFVKTESPEVRGLIRFLNEWDPAVVIDCHTTNGSFHRYHITYEGGRCPAGDERLIRFTRDLMLPEVSRRLEKQTGYRSYFYGNFSSDRRRWETVLPTPRYGTHYVGLRNRIAVLCESYSYAPYKERILASRAFVHNVCAYTAEQAETIAGRLAEARAAVVQAGHEPDGKDQIALRYKAIPLGRPVEILGFVEEQKDGRPVATDKTKAYEAEYWGGIEPVLSVPRPYAYLLPPGLDKVVKNLQGHGISLESLREEADLDLEVYRVDGITVTPAFQKHQPIVLEATRRKERRRAAAGTILVRTGQPLGSLAAHLLEPQSIDGLATWNLLDDVVKVNQDYPVLRIPRAVQLRSAVLPAKE